MTVLPYHTVIVSSLMKRQNAMFCIFVVNEQGTDAKGEKSVAHVATTAQDDGNHGKQMIGEVPHRSPGVLTSPLHYVWLPLLRKSILL